MGVLDKFLDVMKMNDDDDYENEEYFDDEEYVNKPKKSYFKRTDDDTTESKGFTNSYRNNRSTSSKVMPMEKGRSVTDMEVRVMRPTSADSSKDIAEALLDGKTVLLNLEGLDIDIAQRIIDFVSGTTFAIDGNFQKVANYIFVITPENVDISGDLSGMIGAQFGVSSVGNRY